MRTETTGSRILVAMDFSDTKDVVGFCRRADPTLCRIKIGKELFTACGPSIVEQVQRMGYEVFLDLKFHDIPATVRKACRAAADLGVWMLNVHALGGRDMMIAAREGVEAGSTTPLLIAVTVLTSLSDADVRAIGIGESAKALAEGLARQAAFAGVDGVVCSAQEAGSIKSHTRPDFLTVTPGIRPEFAVAGDQKRVMTPRAALEAGADYLVIGRPVTQADDPVTALRRILDEIGR